jgi:hypothetical protein
LNHSITDAGKLVVSFTTNLDQKLAIENYETEMKARAGEEVRVSVINTTMLHNWEKCIASPLVTAGLKSKTT